MIYLFNPIESRAVLTDFNIPEYPNMACDIEIETSGLSVDDYLFQFDSILVKLLEFAVNDTVSTVRKKHKDIDILDRLLLKTFSCAITDKELLDSIIVDSTPFVECKNIVKNIDAINKILMDGKENQEQLKLYRRYINI